MSKKHRLTGTTTAQGSALRSNSTLGNDHWFDNVYNGKYDNWNDNRPWGPGYVGKGQCHEGNVLIGTVGNGHLYAGGWLRGADPKEGWYVVDLASNYFEEITVKGSGFDSVMSVAVGKGANILSLPIRDYQVPNFEPEIMLALAHDIRNLLNADKNVMVCCTGGHGRTGMVVAILAYMLDITSDPDPVKWIREHYCKECVETPAQERYVFSVLGLPVPPSYMAKSSRKSVVPKQHAAATISQKYDDECSCKLCGEAPLVAAWGDDVQRRLCYECIDKAGNEEMLDEIDRLNNEQEQPIDCIYCGQTSDDGDRERQLCQQCVDYLDAKGITI